MPQLRAVFDESYAALDEMSGFTAGVERRLNACLRAGAIPGEDLVDAIAVAKIRCIDVALERAHALRKEVGSYALMHEISRDCTRLPESIRESRSVATL